MNGYVVALLLVTIVWFLLYVPFRAFILRRERIAAQSYRLFAVRDELVRLRIDGDFDAHEDLYHYYSKGCNALIIDTERLTLSEVLRVIRDLTPQREGEVRKLLKRLESAPEPVRRTVGKLYDAMGNILVANSLLLKLVLPGAYVKNLCFKLWGKPPRYYLGGKVPVLMEYRHVSSMRCALG